MILLLYVVVVVALSIFVSWWFVLALLLPAFNLPTLFKRARILTVLASEYQYEFPSLAPRTIVLFRLERETRSQKLNDAEIATLFMAGMVSSIVSDDDEVRTFVRRVRYNASRLSANGSISPTIYMEFLIAVQKKADQSA